MPPSPGQLHVLRLVIPESDIDEFFLKGSEPGGQMTNIGHRQALWLRARRRGAAPRTARSRGAYCGAVEETELGEQGEKAARTGVSGEGKEAELEEWAEYAEEHEEERPEKDWTVPGYLPKSQDAMGPSYENHCITL
ncbi:hypothetical protein H2199_008540 [Coniosporium tulheliwenetii]|uniref:Uncharacterized protein n=1 Tax=Coniosporium tulheliwenetii TaxID=3383036 RepID=A0ACC2YJQ8_9PEZI|nr:hypothetical protein H2199_008540 [Cladosporium sp. JES 115]